MIYRIQVKNHVDTSWSHWFGAMQVIHLENGLSELSGPIDDLEHLHRILEKIRDLNLGLLSVDLVEDNLNQSQDSKKRDEMTAKTYEIRVSGMSSALILDQLDGLTITAIGESNFLLTGSLLDPPALYGVLDRIHEVGLTLISVHYLDDPGP